MNPATTTEPCDLAPDAAARRPLGLYLHIPFCARKCPYCDFNTYAGMDGLYRAYAEALCREIGSAGERHGGVQVDSMFLGGGTPTVLDGADLKRILGAARSAFDLSAECEITSEANPSTADPSRFAALRQAGVNRLSLGVQSLRPDELSFLGRTHGVADVGRAVAAARAEGFDNLSLDLMFGLPGQSRAAWRHSLRAALALEPDHLSLYSLIVESGTPLGQWVRQGKVAAPDDDEAAERYLEAMEALAGAGFVHYEVSNWARAAVPAATEGWASPAGASRHNLRYWRNEDYLGFGPGAHSCLHHPATRDRSHVARRWWNLKPVPDYLARVAGGDGAAEGGEDVTGLTAMAETMMLSLRLVREGLPFSRFRELHGADLTEVYAEPLAELEAWGLVERGASGIRLSQKGLPLGNQVFERFMP